ncbi:hypothetical protein PR048_004892, partial [Dryococelus australis]
MSEHEKESVLLFDEMAIKKWLNYDIKNDMEEGRQDLGQKGTSSDLASQALVGTVKKVELMLTLDLVLEPLLEIGLHVIATVCDQGTSNQKAFN